MSYNFDKVKNRRNTKSLKWSKECIKNICSNENADAFWVADMDFETSDAIKKVMQSHSDFAIPAYIHDTDLTSSFVNFVKKRHSWDVDSSLVTFANGMMHAISLAVSIFTNEKDKVLLPFPSYQPFVATLTRLNREIVPYHFDYKDGEFSLNLDKFTALLDDVKMILFCSPQNPTGLLFSQPELEAILKIAKEKDIIVLSDEIHADLTHPGFTHLPLNMINEKINAKALTFMAPSKTFNIAGEHYANVIFSSHNLKKSFVNKQESLMLSSPSYFAAFMAEAAYNDSFDYNAELTAYLAENSALLESYIKENIPLLKLNKVNVSFICFIDCSLIIDKIKAKYPEIKENILSTFFGKNANLCFNDGTWFGLEYENFVRFNFGTSKENVLKALKKIEEAVSSLA